MAGPTGYILSQAIGFLAVIADWSTACSSGLTGGGRSIFELPAIIVPQGKRDVGSVIEEKGIDDVHGL